MNAAEAVYTELRARILRGELRPGTLLKERDLCERLAVSRTPVREALRRLSADGLAEIRPGRSIVVSTYDELETAEIFELGIALESFVTGLAARKATSEDIARLDALIGEMAAVADKQDARAAYIELDRAFHESIAKIARNRRITGILHQTMNVRLLSGIFQRYNDVDFVHSLAHHRLILEAIRNHDAEWAQAAMGSHIRAGQAAHRRPTDGSD